MKQIQTVFSLLLMAMFIHSCSKTDDNNVTPDETPVESGEISLNIDDESYVFDDYHAGISAIKLWDTENTYSNTFEISVKTDKWAVDLKCLKMTLGDGGDFIEQKTYSMDINHNADRDSWCLPEINQDGDTILLPCGGGFIDVTDRLDWSTYYGHKSEDGFIKITNVDTKKKRVSGQFDSWAIYEKSRFTKDSVHISGSFKDIEYTY